MKSTNNNYFYGSIMLVSVVILIILGLWIAKYIDRTANDIYEARMVCASHESIGDKGNILYKDGFDRCKIVDRKYNEMVQQNKTKQDNEDLTLINKYLQHSN